MNFIEIISQFKFRGDLHSYEEHGNGIINKTFLVVYKEENGNHNHYIVQNINNDVFGDVDKLMDNIEKVLVHKHKVLRKNGKNPYKESLTFIRTLDEKTYFKSNDDSFWRAFLFVDNGLTIEKASTPKEFYECGRGYGENVSLLRDFEVDELHETIPDFHNTPVRYKTFLEAVANDKAKRKNKVEEEINFFLKRSEAFGKIVNLLEKGKIPYRVTHNDTKMNNIIFHKDTKEALVVIDLDTTMKGALLYDFGDAIRFGANTGAEDDKNLDNVSLSIEMFESFSRGFLKETKDMITPLERDNLVFSVLLITYELAMRFLTDYLNGDKYFKVKYDTHNLVRARAQIKLALDVERKIERLENIIENILSEDNEDI